MFELTQTERSRFAMRALPLDSLQASVPTAGWRRLEAYLGQVSAGFDEQLVTPFFKGDIANPSKYGDWYYNHIAKSGIPELDALEEEEIERFNPFSIRLPWTERRQDAEKYFTQKSVANDLLLNKAFNSMKRILPRGSLLPLTFRASFGAMPKDSNLGLPWFTRDKALADSYLERANALRNAGFKGDIYPAVVGWRGQPSDDPDYPKQRVVWMMDHLETIVGLSIQVPLLEKLRPHPWFAGWNQLSIVDKVVTSMIDSTPNFKMSADFSGFDRSLPAAVIHAVFKLLKYWFHPSAESQISWLEDMFAHVGLVTPDGILVGKEGGVPSGSALTNLVDSLAQLLMILPFVDRATVLGDDGVYTGVSDSNELSHRLSDLYGVEVSSDKGGFERDQVRFLQRLHMRNYRRGGICVGVRSLTRTWRGACYLERRIPNLPEEFFSARTIMQLENCHWHPMFRKAVEYFFSVDSVVRHLDPAEVFTRAGGTEFVEKTLGLNSFRFGKELPTAGLDSFETVRELRRMRGSRKST